jgi:hypothetical protein
MRSSLTGYVGIPLIAVAVGTVGIAATRRHRLTILLALWAIVPWIATLLFALNGYSRYTLVAIPPLTAVLAAGLIWIWRWLTSLSVDRTLAAVIVAATLIPQLILDVRVLATPSGPVFPGHDDVQYSTGLFAGTGLGTIHAALDRLVGPGITVVATAYYTPWNLASQFERPLRIPGGYIPYQDSAVVRSGESKIYFVPYGQPGSTNSRFFFTYTSLPFPRGFNVRAYRLVAFAPRPREGSLRPITALLYERTGST